MTVNITFGGALCIIIVVRQSGPTCLSIGCLKAGQTKTCPKEITDDIEDAHGTSFTDWIMYCQTLSVSDEKLLPLMPSSFTNSRPSSVIDTSLPQKNSKL
jgi:hypothetical protein